MINDPSNQWMLGRDLDFDVIRAPICKCGSYSRVSAPSSPPCHLTGSHQQLRILAQIVSAWVVTRALTMGASESFLKHCTDRGFMIRLVDDMTVAVVADELCQARDNIVVDAFLFAHNGELCFCGILSTNHDCAKIFILRVVDVTINGDQQWSSPL